MTQNRAILNQPNSYVYEALGNFVEVSGYYLESDPCLSCNFPETPFVEAALDTLKAEIKVLQITSSLLILFLATMTDLPLFFDSQYTHSAYMVRFSQRNTLQGIHLSISDVDLSLLSSFFLLLSQALVHQQLRQAKMIRSADFFYNNRTVSDINELKNKFSVWKKIGSKVLKKSQTDLIFTFDFPIEATNFMIEFTSFYDNASAAEKLVCPRCNRAVTDKHGICSNCHENGTLPSSHSISICLFVFICIFSFFFLSSVDSPPM